MIQDIFQRVEEVNVVFQYIAVFIVGMVPFLEAFVAVIVFSSFIRTLFFKEEGNHSDHFIHRRFQKAKIYFNKYGVPGISLIGPVIGANHIGALVCIIANANKNNIILWQTISIIIWALGTGLLLVFGVDIYNNIK